MKGFVFEYKELKIGYFDEDALNKLGEEGWELIWVRGGKGSFSDPEPAYRLIFKRPKFQPVELPRN